MKTRFLLLSIGLLSLLCGCGETFCPGFPEELRDWLPYQKGQTLTFANGLGDTLRSKIDQLHIDEDYYFRKCIKCDCGSSSAMFFMSLFNQAPPGFHLEDFEQCSVEVRLKANLLDFSVAFTYSFPEKTPDVLTACVMSISGEPAIATNSQAATRISEVRIKKGKGFVSFHDTRLDCTWTLVEKNNNTP